MSKHMNKAFRLPRQQLEERICVKLTKNLSFDLIIPPTEITELEEILILETKVVSVINF